MKESQHVYGIDLGTTNSCIACYDEDGPRLIPIDGDATVPSVLACDKGTWLVGKKAANFARLHPESAIFSIKRRMGDLLYRWETSSGSLSPIDISAKILSYLKEQAEAAERALGRDVEIQDVVITIPAWFAEKERQSTVEAGKQAGLNVLRLVHEPTAAALAYSGRDGDMVQKDSEQAQRWLVYDLGGGTFDVSVVSIIDKVTEVLASCGNCFLGGDDFDQLLVQRFLTHLRNEYSCDPSDDTLLRARLRIIAEDTKIKLSVEPQVQVRDVLILGDRKLELSLCIKREEFEEMIRPHIDSTLQKARTALEEAKCKKEDLDRVLLVGGSTKIPLVSESVETHFGVAPESCIDPDLSVVLGAATQAGLVSGLEFRQVVLDVSPHSLGIAVFNEEDEVRSFFDMLKGEEEHGREETHDGSFAPMIRRNSRLPARFKKEFFKHHPAQEEVRVRVYQGESLRVCDNTFIGAFEAQLTPDRNEGIFVGFEYDSNGVVRISVEENSEKNALRKYYQMDLSKQAYENTENFSPVSASGAMSSEVVSNFLTQKVERVLSQESLEKAEKEKIERILTEYQKSLVSDDDDKAEQLEDQLYDWVEQQPKVANS